jgi:hypothetical protein
MDSQDRNLTNSAIHGGKPLKSYIKTTLGKVYVTVWDSFEGGAVGVILEGDPRKEIEGCIVDIWSEEEDFYFKNKNRRHLQTGDVITYNRKYETVEKTIEESSDEELIDILNSKFFTIQSALNSTSSVALLFRMKNLASDIEKSDKIMKTIEARISEVQAEEFKPIKTRVVEL